MRHSSFKSMSSLFTLLVLLSIGCSGEVEHEGYCLSDEECAQTQICDPLSRRCLGDTDTPLRTDAALDRVLDMEIDAEIDAMLPDSAMVDAMPSDGAVIDALVSDAALVDATSPLDASQADSTLSDAVLPDAESTPTDALLNETDISLPLDSSVDQDATTDETGNDAAPDAG